MRFIFLVISASMGLVILANPEPAGAQEDRDFFFSDEQGHLVLRFAGMGSRDLTEDQIDEISNAEFSSMVHDRLRADIRIDAEPVDMAWANEIQPRLERHISKIDFDFSNIAVECKSVSCRLLLEQSTRLEVTDHHAVMEMVQDSIRSFIDAHPTRFEAVFLIAAYDKDFQTPAIKAYLRRTAHPK